MGKKLLRLVLAALMTVVLVAATGQTSNQMLSEQDLVDNVTAGNLKWSGSAITGTTKMVTYSEFTTYISNNAACGGSSNELMSYSAMTACRVLATVHDPIISNPSFASGNTVWTQAGVSGTGLYALAPVITNATSEDGDSWYDAFTTSTTLSTCEASGTVTCEGTSAQTFSTGGTPTSQSLSFYYKGAVNTATGDAVNCSPVTGSASVSMKLNSTTYNPTLTLDGSWHQYSTTTTALVNGSNTITFTFTGTTTVNQPSTFHPSTGLYTCSTTRTSNNINIDNIHVVGTW